MNHSFSTAIANEVGVNQAIILQHIAFWVQKNEVNDKNLIDGKYWTYCSIKGFSAIFSYLTASQIRKSVADLESNGFIETANHNNHQYDRTLWYSLTDKGQSAMFPTICSGNQLDVGCVSNASVQKNEPIPDVITYKEKLYSAINSKQLEFLKKIVSDFYKAKNKQYPNHVKSDWHTNESLTHGSVIELYELITIDGWDENDVANVVKWATTDGFWQSNLLSLKTLRKKSKNDMTKFANIHLKYTK